MQIADEIETEIFKFLERNPKLVMTTNVPVKEFKQLAIYLEQNDWVKKPPKALEVWQRLKHPCVHRDGDKCTDSGSNTSQCDFASCPFLKASYAPPDDPTTEEKCQK